MEKLNKPETWQGSTPSSLHLSSDVSEVRPRLSDSPVFYSYTTTNTFCNQIKFSIKIVSISSSTYLFIFLFTSVVYGCNF